MTNKENRTRTRPSVSDLLPAAAAMVAPAGASSGASGSMSRMTSRPALAPEDAAGQRKIETPARLPSSPFSGDDGKRPCNRDTIGHYDGFLGGLKKAEPHGDQSESQRSHQVGLG